MILVHQFVINGFKKSVIEPMQNCNELLFRKTTIVDMKPISSTIFQRRLVQNSIFSFETDLFNSIRSDLIKIYITYYLNIFFIYQLPAVAQAEFATLSLSTTIRQALTIIDQSEIGISMKHSERKPKRTLNVSLTVESSIIYRRNCQS